MDRLRFRAHGRLGTRLALVSRTAAFAFAGFLAMLLLAALPAAAQEDKQGTIIVQFDDYAQVVRPFTFRGEISGLDALTLSGLDVVTASTSFGAAVCSIEGVGCPADNCFCDANQYWAYNAWDGAAWQSYQVGLDSSVISRTGAVEGWRWGAFGDAQAPAPAPLAAHSALDWLAAQGAGGSAFGGPAGTVETLLAIGANHLEPAAWPAPGAPQSLAGAALGLAPYSHTSAAAAGKSTAALAAAGLCLPPTAAAPSVFYSPTLGLYSEQSGANAWALLGTLAAGEMVPPAAISGLADQALDSGGWEWSPGWGADTNSTALALQALLAAGEPVTAAVVTNGLAYLKSAQNDDGGFAYALAAGVRGPSDANSTAYVVQALAAAGQDARSTTWTKSGSDPFDYLLSLRQPDGSFAWQAQSGPNQLATQQVIPALLGRPLPLGIGAGRETAGPLPACSAAFLPGIER